MVLKWVFFLIATAVLASSCASEMSLPEYAKEVEALVTTMNDRFDGLDTEFSDAGDLDDIKESARQWIEARTEFLSGMKQLDAPEAVADLHDEAVTIMGRVVESESAFSEMIQNLDSDSDRDSLWDTPEGVAARAADARAIVLCDAAQETLDSTDSRSELEGVPWIPAEMKEIVRVAFGCHAELR